LKIWKKGKLNSEKIWKIQKKIVKRYEKYGGKVGWIVKWYGKYDYSRIILLNSEKQCIYMHRGRRRRRRRSLWV
jgi:hypothetical protein